MVGHFTMSGTFLEAKVGHFKTEWDILCYLGVASLDYCGRKRPPLSLDARWMQMCIHDYGFPFMRPRPALKYPRCPAYHETA